jgi:hypothetical protein
VVEALPSFDSERDAVTKEPLVNGQQFVAPEESGTSGNATCRKLQEDCRCDSLWPAVLLDEEWRALQQA